MECGGKGFVSLTTIDGVKCVKKRSRTVDASIELEVEILKKLAPLNSWHFPSLIAANLNNYDPEMYVEFIDGPTLFNLLKEDFCTAEMKQSLIGRTLLAAAIMNEELDIVHNDLHRGNVMVRKTSVDIDRYVFKDGQVYEFETFGVEPVIIDFGLANSSGSKMNLTCMFTDIGIFPFECDRLADARRLIPRVFQKTRLQLTDHGWFTPGKEFEDLSEEIDVQLGVTDSKFLGTFDKTNQLVDLFTSRVNLPLVKSKFSVRPRRGAFTDVLNALRDMRIERLKSDSIKLRFIKDVLNKPIKRVKKRYGFSVDSLRRLKSCLKYVLMAVNDIVVEFANMFAEKKNWLYEDSVSYEKTRDVATTFLGRTMRNKPDACVRTYRVATATTTLHSICVGDQNDMMMQEDWASSMSSLFSSC